MKRISILATLAAAALLTGCRSTGSEVVIRGELTQDGLRGSESSLVRRASFDQNLPDDQPAGRVVIEYRAGWK
jgi:hypothetical protein